MTQPAFKFSSLLLLVFLVTEISAQSQSTIKPVVDLRAETISIIFRLAECEEYTGKFLKPYVSDIESHFSSYKNHPAVVFAQTLRKKRGVSYDAVMSMAVHVSNPPAFKPVVEFTENVPDQRWGKKGAEKFVVLLRDFYEDAKCQQFFAEHQSYYATAEQNFINSMKRGVDVNWYTEFYGEKPSGTFNLIIGLGNGANNYGSKVVYPDGREDLFSIISNSLPDSLGFAAFKPENIQSTIIHEYNHSFINHLIYADADAFMPEIKKVFTAVRPKMEALHYGQWEIMVNESLVRAGEIQYDKMHGSDETNTRVRIRNEQARGFVWMDKLDSLLETYKADRNRYPTFESFLPEIVTFYKSLAANADALMTTFENACAHVVKVEPISSSNEIPNTVTELSIQFDKPMGKGISINPNKDGMEHFPFIRSKDSITWSEDGKVLKLKVQLKPTWEYGFILTPLSFKTRDGYPLREHVVNFKTME